ncbi:adenylyl-sulfate kinase [Chloroflexota bacterium]
MESKEKGTTGWVIWFVGLPGAGKSTYALSVYNALKYRGENVRYLSMDKQRRIYFQNPQYTSEERNKAYELFVKEAVQLAEEGNNVIMDGTAPRLVMREYARKLLPYFAEISIRCPLETAMYREANRPEGSTMTNLYNRALSRKQTGTDFKGLGEVVGVDITFEENPMAECVIDSDRVSIDEGRDYVLDFLKMWQT